MSDRKEIERLIASYEDAFGLEVNRNWKSFNKIIPRSSRPFGGYYDKTMI